MAEPWWPQALFFDVDGVLIDSLEVKGEAFADVFDDVEGSRQEVIAFHLSHGGVTRSVKIARLYELLLDETPSEAEVQARVERFAEAVRERVIEAPEIPGASEALLRWSERCPLHAVSATPHEELTAILTARGMAPSFTSMHGWPPAKADAIAQLLTAHDYDHGRTILVGDSAEDLRAAESASIRFIHLRAPGTPMFEGAHPTVERLDDLDRAVTHVLPGDPV